jgi:RimJ/RimL family protein N-acetyltransferase
MLSYRFAKQEDVDLYYSWANDEVVRQNSFNSNPISYDDHVKWFSEKIKDRNFTFYLFFNEEDAPVGQVRIEQKADHALIGISIATGQRGKGYGVPMLQLATSHYLLNHTGIDIIAYIKEENRASFTIFSNAGFKLKDKLDMAGVASVRMIKN